MTAAATGTTPKSIFRLREMQESVEARPVPIVLQPPSKLNPLPSKRYYYLLMAPAIALLAFISIYPFFWMIYMSLHDVEIGSVVWNDFGNFIKLAGDARFLNGWLLLFQYSAMCLMLILKALQVKCL